MALKRIFGREKRKKPDKAHHESPSSLVARSSDIRAPSTSLRPGASVGISALVFHPLIPLLETPISEHTETEAAGITKDTWSNLTAFSGILNRTPVFAPLAAVMDNLSWFIRAHEDVTTTQEEYKTLRTQLEALFKDLCEHFVGSTPPAMTASMLNLCRAIQTELKGVYGTQDRAMMSQLMQANQDLDKITGCCRRIQGHLDRITVRPFKAVHNGPVLTAAKLNASLNIWRVVDKQATEAQLSKLNMSMSARYDSADAHVIQRRECTPNTREQVLSDLTAWKDNPSGEKVCWMNGMAGTGKTTISNTLCSILDKNHELGASFFCTRSLPECRNVKFILPTVAYQLARFSSPFRGAILQALERDPDVHTKVLQVQFKRMILEPLRDVTHSLPSNIVVVLDALDECEDGDGVEQILEVLLEHASELPIKFLVSSRPERHIREKIYHSALNTQLVLHEIEGRIVEADIETYLRAELALISTPPTQGQLAALVERAGTLFIYAATVVRYIKRGDPVERLSAVLNAPDPRQQLSNKTKEIDRLYETVLTSVFDNEDLEQPERERMELVLHTVVCAQEPLTVDALGGLLNLSPTQVVNALKPLWSVLHVSESDVAHRVSTLHASFPDYILDGNRSKQFACDVRKHNGYLSELCFRRIEQNIPQFNICDLESSYMFDDDDPYLEGKVKWNIPIDLLYACQYWAIHLFLGGASDERALALHEFLSKRLLLWMEVLNLTKRLDRGAGQMETVISWLQGMEYSRNTMLLIRDARRFVTMFATSPVSQSTPHLYVSMLASWPGYQPISHCYTQRAVGLVEFKGVETTERQLALLSLTPAGPEIRCVAYSPNGAFFAAGTMDGTILVWDAVTCRMTIEPIWGHVDTVGAITISPDGTQICSGSNDAALCIWDPQNGRLIAGPLEGHTDWIWSVDYSHDGQWLVSGSNHTICVWSTCDWQIRADALNGPIGDTMSVVFSPDDSVIAINCGPVVYLWDYFEGKMIGEPLEGHTSTVFTLAFTPNGEYLISGSSDCTIRVWDTSSGRTIFGPLRGHTSSVCHVAISPDGNLLVSASSDNTIRIWATKTWQTHSTFWQTGIARSVRFSPDGSRLVSGSVDGNIRTWEVPDIAEGQAVNNQSEGHSSWLRSVAFSPCGSYVVSGSEDMTVRLWDSKSGRSLCDPLRGHNDQVLSVGFSADGDHIFSISADRMIRVWERPIDQPEPVYTMGPIKTDEVCNAMYQSCWPAIFVFHDRRVICGSESGRIYIWAGDELSFELVGHDSPVYSIALSPDGHHLVSGSSEGYLIKWDADSGKRLFDMSNGHSSCVNSIVFSPDGSRVASGSRDESVRVWSTDTGLPVCEPLHGHAKSVRSIAWSNDGQYLASGSQDMNVRIWDVAIGSSVAIFRGHTDIILSVQFSPDGTQIVSGSADMTVRLWNFIAHENTFTEGESEASKDLTNEKDTNWAMDEDGWVFDSQDYPLLWVPPDLRSRLLCPQNSILMSRLGCIELDFSKARIGDTWRTCFQPFPSTSFE